MRYGWNLMQSMQKDAIYVARSWYQYEQMVMMQYIFDERKDIMIISYDDILSDDKYRKDICRDTSGLYNEGWLLKCSEEQYDNILVALHNVQEVYDLNYLIQPNFMYDPDGSAQYVDNNVVYSLKILSEKFEDFGYTDAARRLRKFLEKVYNRDSGYYYYYIRRMFSINK